jgi:cell division protein FtsB
MPEGETEMATLPVGDDKPAEEVEDVEAQDTPAEEANDKEAQDVAPVEEKNEGEKEPLSVMTLGVLGACGAMIILYLVAMVIWGGLVVTVAGVVAIFVGAVVSKYQYFDFEDLDSLRTVHNKLRASVNDFSEENTKLTSNNDRLEAEMAPLKESEEKLSQIAEENGSNVKKLTGLVKDNQVTLDEMHKLQKQDVVQSLMDILLQVDRNEDGTLSSQEIKRLRTRVKNLPSIEVDEGLLERKLEGHRQVSAFLNIINQINDDTVPVDERIFKISEGPTHEEKLEEQF